MEGIVAGCCDLGGIENSCGFLSIVQLQSLECKPVPCRNWVPLAYHIEAERERKGVQMVKGNKGHPY